MSFAVGTYGLDNAATVDYGAAHTKGSRFQFRYSAGMGNANSASQFKLCKVGEIAEIVAAGIDFIANSEWSTDRVTAGASAGAADGAADLLFWQSRGLARGASIYVSWDAAPNPVLYNVVAAYLSAYGAALEHYYCDGLYAGIPALNEMAERGLIKHGWIPEASSWSVPNSPIDANYAPPAKTLRDLWQPTPSQVAPATALLASMLSPSLVSCVWQTGNHWPNGSDENVIIRSGPLGSHMEASGTSPSGDGTPVPKPEPLPVPEDDMQKDVIFKVGDGADAGEYWILMTNGYYIPVFNQTESAAYLSVGAVQAKGDVNGASITGQAHEILKTKAGNK